MEGHGHLTSRNGPEMCPELWYSQNWEHRQDAYGNQPDMTQKQSLPKLDSSRLKTTTLLSFGIGVISPNGRQGPTVLH
jgi:hypothetical protein